MGSVGLAERDEPLGRACGAAVTRVDLLELPERRPARFQRYTRFAAGDVGPDDVGSRRACVSNRYQQASLCHVAIGVDPRGGEQSCVSDTPSGLPLFARSRATLNSSRTPRTGIRL